MYRETIKRRDRLRGNIAYLAFIYLFMQMLVLPSSLMAEAVDDAEIANAIESEYWGDEAVPSNQINITVAEGIVSLSGTIDNILAKERAESIAETITGVRSIINRINVVPSSDMSDSEIVSNIEIALLNDPAAESYEVTVESDAGIVTLHGKVDSWQEKKLSEIIAKGVSGVKEVSNLISVDYRNNTQRSDDEIKNDVVARLINDIRVDDGLVTVEVKDGEVSFDGVVGSLQEKNRVFSDGWVSGVKAVETDDLEIRWWHRDEMRRENLYISRSDEEIKEAVEDAFLYDPRIYSFNPVVSVNNATVTLSGVVDNLAAKMAAEQDARNTAGVFRVKNNLKVRPTVFPADDDLKSKISTTMINDPYVNRFDLQISVVAGIVHLTGDVNTSWEKMHAGRLAERINGVITVVNNITFDQQWTWRPDWEIRENINDELFWSIFVDEDQVNVIVNNGVATLTGSVSTLSERRAAMENAFDGGAKDVINNLDVIYRRSYGPYGSYSSHGHYGYFHPSVY